MQFRLFNLVDHEAITFNLAPLPISKESVPLFSPSFWILSLWWVMWLLVPLSKYHLKSWPWYGEAMNALCVPCFSLSAEWVFTVYDLSNR